MSPRWKAAVLWIGIVASAVGCDRDPPGDPVPLSQCLSGWYLHTPTFACTPGSCGEMPPPECNSADCIHWSVEGFLDNGVYYYAFLSIAGQSMSGIGTKQTWAPTANGYTIAENTPSVVDWCTTLEMSADKNIVFRPSAGLSAALNQATVGGATSWTSVPDP